MYDEITRYLQIELLLSNELFHNDETHFGAILSQVLDSVRVLSSSLSLAVFRKPPPESGGSRKRAEPGDHLPGQRHRAHCQALRPRPQLRHLHQLPPARRVTLSGAV